MSQVSGFPAWFVVDMNIYAYAYLWTYIHMHYRSVRMYVRVCVCAWICYILSDNVRPSELLPLLAVCVCMHEFWHVSAFVL